MAESDFLDDFIREPAAGGTLGVPVMLRVSGPSEALDILAQAAGYTDIPAVDFNAWAVALAPKVRDGLDPLDIEAAVERVMREGGCDDPHAEMSRTLAHIFMNMTVKSALWQSPGSVDLDGSVGHGLALPGNVIDRTISSDARRAAFMTMIDNLAEAGPRPIPEFNPEETPFSLVRLIALPAAELVPTWCGRFDPWRHGAKLKMWDAEAGGLAAAAVDRQSANLLVITGLVQTKPLLARSGLHRACEIMSEAYGVSIEQTSWGRVAVFKQGDLKSEKESLMEGFVAEAANAEGIRSAGQLASIMRFGRHAQARRCLEQIRHRVLRPTSLELLGRAAVAVVGEIQGMRIRLGIHPTIKLRRGRRPAQTRDDDSSGPCP